MRTTSPHDPELKAQAMRIYAEQGLSAAVEQTGLPKGTVAAWASRGGVRCAGPETMRESVEKAQLTMAARRAKLSERLMGTIEALNDQVIDSPAIDQQRRASAISTLVTSMQLLSGQATERTEALAREQLITEARERAAHLRVA